MQVTTHFCIRRLVAERKHAHNTCKNIEDRGKKMDHNSMWTKASLRCCPTRGYRGGHMRVLVVDFSLYTSLERQTDICGWQCSGQCSRSCSSSRYESMWLNHVSIRLLSGHCVQCNLVLTRIHSMYSTMKILSAYNLVPLVLSNTTFICYVGIQAAVTSIWSETLHVKATISALPTVSACRRQEQNDGRPYNPVERISFQHTCIEAWPAILKPVADQ
jgi:hypothetical protein